MALLACFIASALFFYAWARRMPLRLAFFAASATWAVALWLITEALSVFHRITAGWLLFAWSLLCLLAAMLARPGREHPTFLGTIARARGLSRPETAIALAIAIILAVTALNAFLAPPNTDDAMEYHLPRMVLWANNQSVSFFPTADVAQLIHSPWAEYAALHLYLLSGSDRLLNFIEWFSFLGCILGASLLAGLLGGSRLSQFLAALLVATLPEAILEASGSDNTAVGALWIVASVIFLLSGDAKPDLSLQLLAGASLGLALLSKGTSALFIPAVLLALLFIRRPKFSRAYAGRVLVVALTALSINAPQGIRNINLSGHALGLPYPEAGIRLRFRSETLAPSAVFSGVVRNAAVHLSVPSSKVNAITEKSLRRLISLTGADPDDPRTTWRDPFSVPGFTTREYFAGNQGQFLLILAVSVLALFRLRPFLTAPVWLIGGCALAFVCFSAALKWNPSASRYHLPLFVLACASVSILLLRLLPERFALAIALLSFLACLLFLADNGLRSFLPMDRTCVFRNTREQLYFLDDYRQDEWHPYALAVEEIRSSGCTEVGLDTMFQSYVYPLMALLHRADPAIRLQYAGVENSTSRYATEFRRPAPCAVICLGCMGVLGKWRQYAHLGGATVIAGDTVVFRPGGQLSIDPPSVGPAAGSAEQLVANIEELNRRLPSLPEFAALAARHELDSPFQDKRGAALRAKRDAVYELRMRGNYLFGWTEPLRLRALRGNATPQDLYVLGMADQALEHLIELVHQRYGIFSASLAER